MSACAPARITATAPCRSTALLNWGPVRWALRVCYAIEQLRAHVAQPVPERIGHHVEEAGVAERGATEGSLEVGEAFPGGIGFVVVRFDHPPHVDGSAAVSCECAKHLCHHRVRGIVVLVALVAQEGAVE